MEEEEGREMSVLSDALLTEVMYLHGHPDYIVPESTLAFMEEASSTIEAQSKLIEELRGALKWMVDNDDTNEGDEPLSEYGGRSWNEMNAYWIDGINKARAALSKANPHSEKVE